MLKVKVTPKVKNVSEYLSGDIFLTTKRFVTKLGMVMLQNEPECHAKQKLFAVFKAKVTARAHIIKLLL